MYQEPYQDMRESSAFEHLYQEDEVKSTLVSRNITVLGRRTSIRLEPEMWMALREIAKRERCSIHDLCTLIGLRKKTGTSLTAAIRVFLMLYFRAASTAEGHERVGHGNFEHMKQRARLPVQMMPMFSRKQKNTNVHAGAMTHRAMPRYEQAHIN